MGVYKENNIYQNQKLIEFVEGLEDKYTPQNLSDKYSNLVNFSKNREVPFHQWFRYREGFASELIEQLINDSGIEKEGIVIDPFAGSGTTPVVAKELGYCGFAIDINPISSFITNIKLHDFTIDELNLIKKEIRKYENSNKIDIEKCEKELESIQCLKRYFTENNFNEIAEIKKYISLIELKIVRDFFMCALLCITENISDRKRDGNGLKKDITKITDVKQFFLQKLNEMIIDIEMNSRTISGNGLCVYGTAEELYTLYEKNINVEQRKGSEKVIIFSPPYPNSFDYFESYKLELVIGDFAKDIRDIKKYRKNAVRSFISVEQQDSFDEYIDLISNEIQIKIPTKETRTGKKDSRTRKVPNMLKGYFYDMKEVINQCYKTINKGNKVYIVVGQSSYLGVIVPTDLLFAYFAENIGFKVNGIVECRKARTSPQQLQRFPYLKNTLRESIVILEK